jgi:hypothetical protein
MRVAASANQSRAWDGPVNRPPNGTLFVHPATENRVSSRVGSAMAEEQTQWWEIGTILFDKENSQRPYDETWAQHLADTFDPDAMSICHISVRADGKRYCVDGQHRIQAVRKLWKDEHQKVECKVYHGLSLAQEAKLFKRLNTRRAVNGIENFLKGVNAGDVAETTISRVVNASGFRVERYKGDRLITAVSTLQYIYSGLRAKATGGRNAHIASSQGHPELLADTLSVIGQAFGGHADSVNGFILEGVARLIAARKNVINIPELVHKMSGYPGGPMGIIGHAKGRRAMAGGTVPMNVTELLVDLYNKKRQERHRIEPLRKA